MLLNGEIAHKLVLLGARGAAAHVLRHLPEAWDAERWFAGEGLGEPGEPPIDVISFNVSLPHDEKHHRLFFFGHGIAEIDFITLGPETRTAMFKRMDHLIVVLDGGAPHFGSCLIGMIGEAPYRLNAIGVRGWSGPALEIEGRTVAVTSLVDEAIAPWLESLAGATVAGSVQSL
jgi:hypothetical protein